MTKTIYSYYDHCMLRLLHECVAGNFRIEKRIIAAGTHQRLYDRKGYIINGIYKNNYPMVALYEGKGYSGVWMSDTQLEHESLVHPVMYARGDVLVGGLGIGMFPTLIKDYSSVKSITIVEKQKDVISLVYPQIQSRKMTIINDDIFHYLETTNDKYDLIHVDIWNSLHAPIKEIEKVRLAAKHCLKTNGIIWCWLQELYDRIKDQLPKEPMLSGGIGSYDPCLMCGKTLRNDYAGLCMDCADLIEVSELFLTRGQG